MALLHELAIRKIILDRPGEDLRTVGLGKFLRSLDKKYGFCINPKEITRRIPDAWSYVPFDDDESPGAINLYEVEDGHPISEAKMRDYADFAFMCDFYDLDVNLFVYDRYGENQREVSLLEYFYMFLVSDHAPGGRLHNPSVYRSAANDNQMRDEDQAA